MGKNNIFIIAGLITALILSYSCAQDKSNVAIQINNFKMTQGEFEEEFKESGLPDEPAFRRQFLENLINRKLILQEAEEQGLNKEKDFLKTIERHYEQSLLKIMLDKKSKEIAGGIFVNEREIETRYGEMIEKGLIDKALNEVYTEIKWQVLQEKQTTQLDNWIKDLYKKARIEVKEKIKDGY